MNKGLYRTSMPHFGECARVTDEAGDAAPFLSREMYELLNFEPKFDALPARTEFQTSHPHEAQTSKLDDGNLTQRFGLQ
ncbi:MAG: hypothetical protein KDE49_15515 [Novosphingobium sp.]|nr:hypothetical protein [Novosphingobium sp.]